MFLRLLVLSWPSKKDDIYELKQPTHNLLQLPKKAIVGIATWKKGVIPAAIDLEYPNSGGVFKTRISSQATMQGKRVYVL